jgi:hypothetical protein
MPTNLKVKTSKFLKIKGFCFLAVRTSVLLPPRAIFQKEKASD